ncbi:MAG: hypothetical protein JWL83_4035 [Actinomycetia bacterium]|nr:hypothetical protein [Actinomycetes bacterium]
MPPMDNRQIALILGRGRAVIGLAALVLPGATIRLVLGAGAATPPAKALTRMLGVRDFAIGIGAITSVKEETQGPEWLSMGAFADGIDAVVFLTLRDAPRRARLIGVAAAGSAVFAMKVSRDLADARAVEAAARDALGETGA